MNLPSHSGCYIYLYIYYILYHYIICFVLSLGNSYVVGSIQAERGTGLSRLESGIDIVIRSTTLVSSSLPNLKPTVMGVCMMQMIQMNDSNVCTLTSICNIWDNDHIPMNVCLKTCLQ